MPDYTCILYGSHTKKEKLAITIIYCNNQDVCERYNTSKTIILDCMVATILVIASWFEKHLTKLPPKEIATL